MDSFESYPNRKDADTMRNVASPLTKANGTPANGYVLHETNTIAVIATGIHRRSDNEKTGPMIQVYILHRHIHPTLAVQTGADAAICLDCIHRADSNGKGRTCYVTMNGPNSVFRAYQRGDYPYLPLDQYAQVFAGEAVRLGTYGDPCLIPLEIIREIVRYCDSHTGYTHQWGRIDGEYMQYLMASCDIPQQATEAHSMGYRTFRVVAESEEHNTASEIVCPANSRNRQCIDCKLCSGATKQAKSILIAVHGSGKGNLQAKLVQLVA